MFRALATTSQRCCTRRLRLKSYFNSSAIWSKPPKRDSSEEKINFNPELSFDETVGEHAAYPQVSARELAINTAPPKRVKMLVRDYIEDSLYNPHYGYFSQRASIFTSGERTGDGEDGFDFGRYRDAAEFEAAVAQRYTDSGAVGSDGPGKQLWHTPTELFKPWYGQAIAQCLVSEYLLKYFPYEDFVIYEIGAGNGTLARNILDYIRLHYPDVYERTRYTIIEISAKLARAQRHRLQDHSCVRVVNKSVFHWEERETNPCYFIAMEVIDNFAHDVVRYDLRTMEPYQGVVAIDQNGEFVPFYSRISDPLVSSFLALRRRLSHPPTLPRMLEIPTLRKLYTKLPFAANLSPPEYIPTRLLSLLQVLRQSFPRHRLLLSDFSSLPDSIPGVNAPVVQTRVGATMVPCSTLFVRQGYFDILFPTNFERLRDMYEDTLSQPHSGDSQRPSPLSGSTSPLSLGAGFFSSFVPDTRRHPLDGVTSASGLPVGERKSSVFTHAEFLETYADLGRTRLGNGENPMVEFYKNVKFLF
ncbi:DUF185-domain-containing protein [Hygrophoropsis aurantiaca]|uniref:DUF185-domain-containing protein n=1 Tax=Hygrophoropsis aurantiaca TaxID=72124 RepID=A0ACB8AKI8_9AGAM|nr:DUF185-domain-containing protein [Hygrophoropsis aurantiaca]